MIGQTQFLWFRLHTQRSMANCRVQEKQRNIFLIYERYGYIIIYSHNTHTSIVPMDEPCYR